MVYNFYPTNIMLDALFAFSHQSSRTKLWSLSSEKSVERIYFEKNSGFQNWNSFMNNSELL